MLMEVRIRLRRCSLMVTGWRDTGGISEYLTEFWVTLESRAATSVRGERLMCWEYCLISSGFNTTAFYYCSAFSVKLSLWFIIYTYFNVAMFYFYVLISPFFSFEYFYSLMLFYVFRFLSSIFYVFIYLEWIVCCYLYYFKMFYPYARKIH